MFLFVTDSISFDLTFLVLISIRRCFLEKGATFRTLKKNFLFLKIVLAEYQTLGQIQNQLFNKYQVLNSKESGLGYLIILQDRIRLVYLFYSICWNDES